MKKYKLLKDTAVVGYDSCIIKASSVFTIFIEDSYRNKEGYYFSKEFVESHPEWFEEVIEKDWEILSYYNSDNYSNPEKRMCSAPNYECEREGCAIFSVKRLNDGEIFTVGDESLHKDYLVNKPKEIISFEIVNNDMRVKFKGGENYKLASIVKAKPPERAFALKDIEFAFTSGLKTMAKYYTAVGSNLQGISFESGLSDLFIALDIKPKK